MVVVLPARCRRLRDHRPTSGDHRCECETCSDHETTHGTSLHPVHHTLFNPFSAATLYASANVG